MKKIRNVWLLASALVFQLNCQGQASIDIKRADSVPLAAVSNTVNISAQSGGVISLGTEATLTIPPNALDTDQQISITRKTGAVERGEVIPVGYAYEFGPKGLEFAEGATLEICYPPSNTSGIYEESTQIYYDDASGYLSYGGEVDSTKHCVKTEIYHFSTYLAAALPLLTTNTPPIIGGVNFVPSTPMAGIPLRIRSVINDFNAGGKGQVASVWLHYRKTGDPTFKKVAMVPDTLFISGNSRYTYTIPSSDVTLAGIEYFIEAIDNLRLTRISNLQTRTISSTATSLSISPSNLDIAAGFNRQFQVQITDDNGLTRNVDPETFQVNGGIGTVSQNEQTLLLFSATTSGDPLGTGFRTGTLEITLGSLVSSSTINVWPGQLANIEILDTNGIILGGSTLYISPGATFEVDARGVDSFGNYSLVYPTWVVLNDGGSSIGNIPSNDGIFIASNNIGATGNIIAIVDNHSAIIPIEIGSPPMVNPVPGNGGLITFSNITANAFDIQWTKATDDTTPQSGLQYNVAVSPANNLTTPAAIESSQLSTGYLTDIDFISLSTLGASLPSGATFFVNIVVKDADGNKSVYSQNSQATLGTPGFLIGGQYTGLTGDLLLELNNGLEQLLIQPTFNPVNGSWFFPTTRPDLFAYTVSVIQPPTGKTCTVANGTGTINSTNVSNIQIDCN